MAFIYDRDLDFISKADKLINDTRTYWIGGAFLISTYRGVVRVGDYFPGDVDLSNLQEYVGTAGEKQTFNNLFILLYKINVSGFSFKKTIKFAQFDNLFEP